MPTNIIQFAAPRYSRLSPDELASAVRKPRGGVGAERGGSPTAPTPQLPVLFGSRQARSNGRRQAFGAIS